MKATARITTVVIVASWLAAAPVAAQAPAGSAALTVEEQEAFLRTADIQDVERINIGTTGAQVAVLTDGTFSHQAQIQTFDESRPSIELGGRLVLNFVDSYRYNIAAYEVAKLLGIDNVPVSVYRRVNRDDASLMWWVDGVRMDEEDRQKAGAGGEAATYLAQQLQRMYVFDNLIYNWDRNKQNMLWTGDWKLWMIDHTRSFRLDESLRTPQELNRIERSLFESVRGLTAEAVAAAVGDALTEREIDALMARRDLLVAHYDARIAQIGEDLILYTMTPP